MPQLDLFNAQPSIAEAPASEPRGSAVFSPCKRYRYSLGRVLDPDNERTLTMIGANPSKADAVDPDRTVDKMVGFCERWKVGRLVMVNARAFIATEPKDMKRAAKDGFDVIGPDNEEWIRKAIGMALLNGAVHGQPPLGILLLACGRDVGAERLDEIMRQVRFGGVPPMCLGVNGNGTPEHPLYVPFKRPLVPFVWPPESAA